MSGTVRAAWLVLAAFGIVVAGSSGCSQDRPPRTAAESRPISGEEALEFGEGLVDAFERLDAGAIEEAIDMDAVMTTASEGVAAPDQFREAFVNGGRKARARDGSALLVELRPAIEAGAELRATRALEWQGRPAFLLRVLQEQGISYVVLLLDRRPDGRIRAVDYYGLVAGELASQAARRLYVAGVAQANRGILDRLLGRDLDLFKHMDDLKRMAAANREGHPEEVLTIYDALPEGLKSEKIFQMQRYAAAQKTGDDAKYLDAIREFARRFPGDPGCDYVLIDGYILMEEPEKALPCIDRLEKVLGSDAYLKVLRGSVLTLLKRHDDAAAAYRAALEEEPDLRLAYDGLIDAALSRKRFGAVAELLDALESEFDEEIGDLSEVEEYAEFLASPEGKAWTARRPMLEPEAEPTQPAPAGEDAPASPPGGEPKATEGDQEAAPPAP